MTTDNASHFCGTICFVRLDNGEYEMIGVEKEPHPGKVFFPGGTNKNCLWETVAQTESRELREETGLYIIKSHFLHEEKASIDHTKYFFVCTKFGGSFDGPKHIDEADGESIFVSVWSLADFYRHVFGGHRVAFMKFCRTLALVDREFRDVYPEICLELFRPMV